MVPPEGRAHILLPVNASGNDNVKMIIVLFELSDLMG
jgi:hypothetical protein